MSTHHGSSIAGGLAVIGLALANAASAADAPPAEAKFKHLLLEVLNETSLGNCPDNLMDSLMKTQCEKQIPLLKNKFSRLGFVVDAEYNGTGPNGSEVYRVFFSNGQMVWAIKTGASGKIETLWSPRL